MSLNLQWLTKESGAQSVGRTRALAYAPTLKEIEVYQKRLQVDGRVVADDLLLAEQSGIAVGTSTSYSMNMWVRGKPIPCQGVAWVGTVKTHRRSDGVATQIMRETLHKARERGQILSALMPFRGSYYDHFGYGVVERRATWTIPLSILPAARVEPFTVITGADEPRRACRQRMVEAGHCDIERAPGFWDHWTNQQNEGYVVADLSAAPQEGPIMRSYFNWEEEKLEGKNILKIYDYACDSLDSLRRALNYFATLKDQYWGLKIALPADLQLNRLLNETQVGRIPLNHATAEVKSYTRMQVRVLDHVRLIAALHLPEQIKGQFAIAINETESTTTTLGIEIKSTQAVATLTSAPADIECSDRMWAAMILGDLPATRAAELGLIKVHNGHAPPLLDAFAAGPAPFCNEYF
jgi:predicted acetyltransferase